MIFGICRPFSELGASFRFVADATTDCLARPPGIGPPTCETRRKCGRTLALSPAAVVAAMVASDVAAVSRRLPILELQGVFPVCAPLRRSGVPPWLRSRDLLVAHAGAGLVAPCLSVPVSARSPTLPRPRRNPCLGPGKVRSSVVALHLPGYGQGMLS